MEHIDWISNDNRIYSLSFSTLDGRRIMDILYLAIFVWTRNVQY